MTTLTLTPRERAVLERLARSTRDAAQLRRVAALLALADGQPATAVARSRRVGRSTLYEWVGRFEAYRRRDMYAATTSRTAPGRDRDLRDRVRERVMALLGAVARRLRLPAHQLDDRVAHRAAPPRRDRGQRLDGAAGGPRGGVSLEAAPVRPLATVADVAAGKGGLQRGLKGRRRTVVLFSDATILTETPPLRACWAKVGEQAEVPITGNRARRVVYGTLNVGTGELLLDRAATWNQDSFQEHLRHLRSPWRGWDIVLFIDRGRPHRAKRSRALAAELGIELRWLPVACPELNPLEGLWRAIKGSIPANEPTPDLDVSPARAFEHLEEMTPRQRLKTAGVLSGSFWLPT